VLTERENELCLLIERLVELVELQVQGKYANPVATCRLIQQAEAAINRTRGL
jgi:hypothetical protein